MGSQSRPEMVHIGPHRLRINRSLWRFLSVSIFAIALMNGTAQPSAEPSAKSFNFDSAKESVWDGNVGEGFRKHAMEAGILAGGGYGLRVFGGRTDHHIALGTVHVGTMLSGPVAKDRFWRGNFELLGDLFGGEQFNSHTAYLVGIAPMIRYNFATGTRFVPFVGGGAGLSLTDIRHPDLSTDFEFNVQVDGGMHWFFKPNMAATIEGRWLHLSNAGFDTPNLGVNTSMLLVGVNWFF